MRYFVDTEFVEDGVTIDLISIAIFAEDGREYYAISDEFNITKATFHPFVGKHVVPIILEQVAHGFISKHRKTIGEEIVEFVGPSPEFWGDFASYDWVALCQIYGTMMDLPQGWPFFIRDVQQFRKMLGVEKFTVLEGPEHDARHDARECHARWKKLNDTWEQMKASL